MDTALEAFAASSGIMPEVLSLAVRTLIFSLTCFFGVYVSIKLMNRLREAEIEFLDVWRDVFGVILVITIVMVIVYV